MKKLLYIFLLFCIHVGTRGQTRYGYYYWFDDDVATMKSGTAQSSNWQFQPDVSSLESTFHTIHILVNDDDGKYSSPITRYFFKCSNVNNIYDYLNYEYYYWFDDDITTLQSGTSQTSIWQFSPDVNKLTDSFHTIHIQVRNTDGTYSSPITRYFIKCGRNDSVGTHYKMKKLFYTIDGTEYSENISSVGDGTFHFNLDVSNLEDGVHRLTYHLSDGQGNTTRPRTNLFVKTPTNGYGITEYSYWQNDQNPLQAKTVSLPESMSPFSLVASLPVEPKPIRSTQFDFQIKDSKPVICAKNDIHIRFYDVKGRFNDITNEYVDESVNELVIPVGEIQETQTFDNPDENKIRWYTINMFAGDSVMFKTSQQCTMQLFSPTGAEVYNVTGSSSVDKNGVRAWEEGTYYLAVHNVTGTEQTTTLNYYDETEKTDLTISLEEGWNWISHNLRNNIGIDMFDNPMQVLGQNEEIYNDNVYGMVGDLKELKPYETYKIQVADSYKVRLTGKLFNSAIRTIGLAKGWNWIGYPLASSMDIATAFENFTPSDYDYIIGQDGFALYSDGEWSGTLTTLVPGKGYIYKSGVSTRMSFNSSEIGNTRQSIRAYEEDNNCPWICDPHKYPNVMPVIAQLFNNGDKDRADDYYVAAFCRDECRGVGKVVNDVLMISVYGDNNETITFRAIKKDSDELFDIIENTSFVADVTGTLKEPFKLTLGSVTTGVTTEHLNQIKITPTVIQNNMFVSTEGDKINRLTIINTGGAIVRSWKNLPYNATVDVSDLPVGMYIVKVKAGKQSVTKKIMKVAE